MRKLIAATWRISGLYEKLGLASLTGLWVLAAPLVTAHKPDSEASPDFQYNSEIRRGAAIGFLTRDAWQKADSLSEEKGTCGGSG